MKKSEVNKLLNKIKGYYNSQFFIDDNVLNAWDEQLQDYSLEDCEEHLKEYLKEYPEHPPKPHTFIKGMLTIQEKEKRKHAEYIVQCNLCQRWMTIEDYDNHYGKCLDIEYLVGIAKEKGEAFDRKDLENCRQNVIEQLLRKYEPKNNIDKIFKNMGE